jgi:KamA family protein
MLSDSRLAELCGRLDRIPHLDRLRIHTRLPIVLPERLTAALLELLRGLRMRSIVVVHANHPAEIAGDCALALARLVHSGLTVLNQSVLLRSINDSADVLADLSERLVNCGVLPYYLHQLDPVTGTAHYRVSVRRGRRLVAELRRRLPGYAVPRYVREERGEAHKSPLA